MSNSITLKHRGLVIIAIDQSGSMQDAFRAHSLIMSKSETASMIASALLDEIIVRSQLSGTIYNCLDIGVVGYSNFHVDPLLHHKLYTVPISLLENENVPVNTISYYLKNQDGHLSIYSESYSDRIVPKAAGYSNVDDMLNVVFYIARDWCNNPQNHDSLPPIVINLTDGDIDTTYKSELIQQAEELRELGTNRGKLVLFNVIINSDKSSPRLDFPNPDQVTKGHPIEKLALISGELPEVFYPLAKWYNPDREPPYLSMCYNATILSVFGPLKVDRSAPERDFSKVGIPKTKSDEETSDETNDEINDDSESIV